MKIYTAAFDGLVLNLVRVEADISNGLPSFLIVGLGDASIKEARERIRPALKNSGFAYPQNKKVINLCPADLKKQGSHFDLPIAVSMLYATDQMKDFKEEKIFCAGELMLSGNLRKITGALAITHFAKKHGFKSIFLPYQNRKEASLIKGINIYPVKNLREMVRHFEGGNIIKPYLRADFIKDESQTNKTQINFSDILGQEIPKRALEIAAASRHHILMYGPPGTGKTMLAKAFSCILPDLTEDESMDSSMIYSIAGSKTHFDLPVKAPQFRHIHHSTTSVTLLGGGNPVFIGEATLAHNGVLFLDEIAEFSKQVLEDLREPLQEGLIRLGRYGKTAVLPANFQLIAAMNPCPCGYFGDTLKKCQCTHYQIKQYYKKISGPILDRIDLVVEVPRLKREEFSKREKIETSDDIQKRVVNARNIQKSRGILNSQLSIKDIGEICMLDSDTREFLQLVLQKLNISPRSYLSLLKVSRTIADLENSAKVKKDHIAEAVQYRKDFIY